MSILGVVARVMPAQLPTILSRLHAIPGVELGDNPDDGRLVLVIESLPGQSAAATMADMALWPEVLSISLVYEHTLDDGDPASAPVHDHDYRMWRSSLRDLASTQAVVGASPLSPPVAIDTALERLRAPLKP